METPHIDHLTPQDYEHVYEPAEDSFLLLDALEKDLHFIENVLNPQVCLEIGPGSGILITALAKRLKNSLFLACDINSKACEISKSTALRNLATVDCIQGNLVDSIKCNSVDLLIFNPPYVVTTDQELYGKQFGCTTSADLISSWAGGQNGRRIVDLIMTKLPNILSKHGVFYLLLLRENKPDEVIKMAQAMNFKSEIFMERRIPGELLFILKFTKL